MLNTELSADYTTLAMGVNSMNVMRTHPQLNKPGGTNRVDAMSTSSSCTIEIKVVAV